ncbi:MAG: ABC transporter permease [Firmicutes bacterium]|nr:ABC transporter permease [Bacillota bacterium]
MPTEVLVRADRLKVALSGTRRFFADRFTLVFAVILLTIVFLALFAPYVVPHDPFGGDLMDRLEPPAWSQGGSTRFLLGTDAQGRDLLSRLMVGARVSLSVGLGVVVVAGTVGTVLGLVAGYFGGKVDQIIMRILDIQFAFPGLLIGMTIAGVLGPNLRNIMIALSVNGWMVFARLIRGMVMSIKARPFVEAAEAVGCSKSRIIFVHIFPHALASQSILAVIEVARIIMAEASLSFLGLGIQPPGASWGLMLAEGREYISTAWWLVTFPGLAILVTIISLNIVANRLRSFLDPLQQRVVRV